MNLFDHFKARTAAHLVSLLDDISYINNVGHDGYERGKLI